MATEQTLILRVDVAREPGQAVVVAAGEIDASVIHVFREALRQAVAFQEPTIVVDLSQVTYMDSGSIYAILDAWKEAGRRPEGFALRLGNSPATRVVETIGLHRLMTVSR
jgi:anti-anti-sigma factor